MICASLLSVGAWVAADKLLLMRLIDNLIGNAIKYTSHGGVLITIRNNTARKLYLEVWDTGIGVAEVDVHRIFEPYVQIGNPTRNREKGLGLGLAIVKSCADLMAIPIVVTSKLGKGSRFRITLTKTNALPSFTALPLEKPPSNGGIVFENTFKGLKVLVLEDDPLVTSAIEALFLSWAIDFKHASSFDELRLGEWVPQLVLCDFRLPGRFDGLATLELISQRFPAVACVLQTGELSPEIALKAKSKGYGLLVKPVEVNVLAKAIKNSLVH
jgi:two-component system, sensor histidine kinase